jgi:hypothetical protein
MLPHAPLPAYGRLHREALARQRQTRREPGTQSYGTGGISQLAGLPTQRSELVRGTDATPVLTGHPTKYGGHL